MNSAESETYQKGGDGGKHGTDFQVDVSTMVFLNAIKNGSSWKFSCENKKAGIFDDLVIENTEARTVFFVQTKHKHKQSFNKQTQSFNEQNEISYADLLSELPDDFSLLKYFSSYQKMKDNFAEQTILIICTNLDIQYDEEYVNKALLSKESPLYLDGRKVFSYTFKKPFVDKFEKTLKKYIEHVRKSQRKLPQIDVSDKSLEEFFSRLQLVANYPDDDEIHLEFEKVIRTIEFAKDLKPKLCADHILQRISTWFRSREIKEGRIMGEYLTKAHQSAFFCEIRSDMYIKSYNIDFKNTKLPLKESNTRVLHIISEQDPILNVIITFQELPRRDITKILSVNKDQKIEILMQIIEAFGLKHYTHLVIEGVKARADDEVQKMYKSLSSILSQSKDKRVILIAEKDDRLVEKFKHSDVSFEALETEELSFSDLSDDSQKRYREMSLFDFQGTKMNLHELLPTLTSEEVSKIVNKEMLKKFIRKENITIGKKLDTLGDIVKYYIPRRFNRNGENIAEEKMWQHIQSSEEKVIVIADSPGMGKSTVLTSLASAIKETSPSLWVLRINVITYRNILWKLTQKKVVSISLRGLLDSLESSSTDFEKEIFSLPKKVVLMIDGADEASPECKEIILSLIAKSKEESNFAKIFITTRPHLRNEIEEVLGVTSWTLEPFSTENQINFLEKYFITKLKVTDDIKIQKCRVYVKTLVTETSPSITASFEGIPLQLSLLAEIFVSKTIDSGVEESKTCEKFLDSNSEKPKLLELNVAQLFDKFISKKWDQFVVHYKLRNSLKTLKECKRYHFILALKTSSLVREYRELFDCYKEKEEENMNENNLLKLGIIQKVDGKMCFTHSMFADYFVAKCVIKQLRRETKNGQFWNHFLTIILKYQGSEIRTFFQKFLRKEMERFHSITYEGIGVELNCREKCDFLFELTFCGFAAILKFIFKCSDTTKSVVDINAIGTFGETLLHIVAEKHVDITRLLIERGAQINAINKEGCTALHVAALFFFLII